MWWIVAVLWIIFALWGWCIVRSGDTIHRDDEGA